MVGEILKKERRKNKLTLKEMENITGISSNILSNLEKGKIKINKVIYLTLKKKLNLNLPPCDDTNVRELCILERFLNEMTKNKFDIAIDFDNDRMIGIAMFNKGKRAYTVINYKRLKENRETIKNEAKAILYELTKKLQRKGAL